ncbi:MarR family winged helix-turn-helix transcriptional regulator [Pseudonocardia asaccharolytica]|uniref:MarR family transcriptional regulator n=1 Tax=Pseudonocardia asaccharolytica DSM 44247 = NBRC 16224 TaxID=1123024 RepID=A0A511CZU5_9PSEU|nr:MarR family transcriptional regulator [Pseudonocardia asaccharolytica]GEL17793.1 MarR family transcriptional regulator [Pseudonocardia asaccharolytica DSM 44247 = NBRC 16224]
MRDAIDQVEAAMIAVRRRQTRRTLAREAGAADDTVQQVLDTIEEAEQAGRSLGVTALAAALGVDQPRASKLAAGAVAAGFVRREAEQHDGRRSRLMLTEMGRERLAAVHRHRRSRFAAAMDGWTPAERAEFARLLTRFVAGL